MLFDTLTAMFAHMYATGTGVAFQRLFVALQPLRAVNEVVDQHRFVLQSQLDVLQGNAMYVCFSMCMYSMEYGVGSFPLLLIVVLSMECGVCNCRVLFGDFSDPPDFLPSRAPLALTIKQGIRSHDTCVAVFHRHSAAAHAGLHSGICTNVHHVFASQTGMLSRFSVGPKPVVLFAHLLIVVIHCLFRWIAHVKLSCCHCQRHPRWTVARCPKSWHYPSNNSKHM